MRRTHMASIAAVLVALGSGGCEIILGLDKPAPPPPPSGSGGSAGTTTTNTGSGADGGGGASGCTPSETVPCYEGPAGTAGVGICKTGTQTCLADGSGFGACENQVLPAAEDCATPADEDCDGATQSCKGEFLWAKRFGPKDAASSGYVTIRNLAADSEGNVVAVGAFTGTMDFGGVSLTSIGLTDTFVAKLNGSTGATFWAKRFGDAATQEALDVAVDPDDNIVLAGSFQGAIDLGGGLLTSVGGNDAFIAKLDKDGQHVWSKSFGDGDYQEATGVAIDGAGNIALAGSFAGTIDFGKGILTSAGNRDVFVASFDPDGGPVWSKRFGNISVQTAARVARVANGDVLLSGQFAQAIDLGGGSLVSLGDKDIFAARLDATGAYGWSNSFGGADEQTVSTAATDTNGNILLVGSFYGSITFGDATYESAGDTDGFVAVLKPDGTPSWSKKIGDGALQKVTDIASDPLGNVVIAAAFDGAVDLGGGPLSSAGPLDILVAKFGADGAYQWSKRFGDAKSQQAVTIATDKPGNVLLGGTFSGTVDFGGAALTAKSTSFDSFVTKFGP